MAVVVFVYKLFSDLVVVQKKLSSLNPYLFKEHLLLLYLLVHPNSSKLVASLYLGPKAMSRECPDF